MYGWGHNEALLGRALKGRRRGVIVATKFGMAVDDRRKGARPEYVRRACDDSLKRLGMDCIDLYQLHAPDPEVPFEDSVGTLADLKAEGKIRLVGVSNVDLEELEIARGIVDVASVQNRYNLHDRESDDVIDRCEQLGIAFFPWFPLAVGRLAAVRGRSRSALARIARAHGATSAQVALAWLLARSPVMVPIPGTSSIEHLEENVEAAAVRLSEDEVEELNEEEA